MKWISLLVASAALLPHLAGAQAAAQGGPPGPSWKPVVPGRPVFITADSVSRIGTNAFRYVIFRRLGDAESLETAEVRCADHTRRTIRLITRGKYIVPDKSGKHMKVQATPNDSFEKPFPGGAADVILQQACDLGRAKFSPRKRR